MCSMGVDHTCEGHAGVITAALTLLILPLVTQGIEQGDHAVGPPSS